MNVHEGFEKKEIRDLLALMFKNGLVASTVKDLEEEKRKIEEKLILLKRRMAAEEIMKIMHFKSYWQSDNSCFIGSEEDYQKFLRKTRKIEGEILICPYCECVNETNLPIHHLGDYKCKNCNESFIVKKVEYGFSTSKLEDDECSDQ